MSLPSLPGRRTALRFLFIAVASGLIAALTPATFLGLTQVPDDSLLFLRLLLGLVLFAGLGVVSETIENERRSTLVVARVLALKQAYDSLAAYRPRRARGHLEDRAGHQEPMDTASRQPVPGSGSAGRKTSAPAVEKEPDIIFLSRLADARLNAHRSEASDHDLTDWEEAEAAPEKQDHDEGAVMSSRNRSEPARIEIDDGGKQSSVKGKKKKKASSAKKTGKIIQPKDLDFSNDPVERAVSTAKHQPSAPKAAPKTAPETSYPRTDADHRSIESELRVLQRLVERLDQGIEDWNESDDPAKTAKPLFDLQDAFHADRIGLQGRFIADLIQPAESGPLRVLCEPAILNRSGSPDVKKSWRIQANEAGMVATIDNIMLYRALRLIQQVAPELGDQRILFACRISQESFSDPAFFGDILPYLSMQGALASSLALVISHATILETDTKTLDRLGDLSELGLIFGLGDCGEPDPDLINLGRIGFRFIETPITRLKVLGKTYGADGIERFRKKRLSARIELCASGIRTHGDLGQAVQYGAELGYGDRLGKKMPVRSLMEQGLQDAL